MIVGTRPEVIKLAPVYKALKRMSEMDARWISTGQHKELLVQSQKIFEIETDHDLNLMHENQSPLDIIHAASAALKEMWDKRRPDLVVVQGDTATAFSAALTAFYMRIPVAHVEAGLRSNRIDEPFPEESHRRMIGAMTTLHFAPTKEAVENLLQESMLKEAVFNVGNTVVDALQSLVQVEVTSTCPKISKGNRRILVTAHRRENHGERLESICKAILDIRDEVSDVEFIYPVHPNPNVQSTVNKLLENEERIHLAEPMDYLEFLHVIRSSYLILTDSGGIQEEAPSYSVPVLILREQTERPEVVDAGIAKLVGSDRRKIKESAIELLTNHKTYEAMRAKESPFGDGKSSERIATEIQKFLLGSTRAKKAN